MVQVQLKQIRVKYQDKYILDKLSLEISHGILLVVLGESGCGKTTLLKVIAGIITPETGTVWFDNQNITRQPPQLRRVGYVPQAQILFPHLNVHDNITFGIHPTKKKKMENGSFVQNLAHLVQIDDLMDRFPSELSGGQKQRVALARAMAIEPNVLLLDEPLSSLDASARESMALTIRKIQQETNTTVVYVTHNLEETRLISDQIAILFDGQIKQFGSIHIIIHNPKSLQIARIMNIPNIWPILNCITNDQLTQLSTSLGNFEIKPAIPDISQVSGIRIPCNKIKICLRNQQNNMDSTYEEVGIFYMFGRILSLDPHMNTCPDINSHIPSVLHLIIEIEPPIREYVKVELSCTTENLSFKENDKVTLSFRQQDLLLI